MEEARKEVKCFHGNELLIHSVESNDSLDTSNDYVALSEVESDSNDSSCDGGLDQLSTTLKEIDESLTQQHGDQLLDSINASSEYLKELLRKQKVSHRKIQKFQESIQQREIQVAMIQPDQFDSRYSIEMRSDGWSKNFPTTTFNQLEERDYGNSHRQVQTEILMSKAIVEGNLRINCEENSISQVKFDATIQKEATEEEDDELLLFFDLMAAHIKHEQLERERIKLDVIVALRIKLQALYDDESIENIPVKLAEKLYENMYEILLQEVTKVKVQDEEKYSEQRQKYELDMTKLTKELETMAKEKCEACVQLNSCKEQLSRYKETSFKSDRLEGRVSYLEDVLRSVEKENDKHKGEVKQLHDVNSALHAKIRTLENDLQSMSGKYNSLQSCEEQMKLNYHSELQKLIEQNNSLNNRLFTLQNSLQDVTRERDQFRNSNLTDRTIIKHLEQKLSKDEVLLENVTNDSTKNLEKNLALEAKVVEYKQKLKKCARGIEITRQQNLKLKESMKAVESERDEYRRSGHEFKLQLSEEQLRYSSEISILQSKVDGLQKNVNVYKDKMNSLQRANLYLNKQVQSAPVNSISGARQNMSCLQRGQAGVNKSSTAVQSTPESSPSVPSSSPVLPRPPSQKIYTGNEMKLFLKEMAYKLEHTENEVRLADQLVSNADIDSQLEEKVAQIRLQMANISSDRILK